MWKQCYVWMFICKTKQQLMCLMQWWLFGAWWKMTVQLVCIDLWLHTNSDFTLCQGSFPFPLVHGYFWPTFNIVVQNRQLTIYNTYLCPHWLVPSWSRPQTSSDAYRFQYNVCSTKSDLCWGWFGHNCYKATFSWVCWEILTMSMKLCTHFLTLRQNWKQNWLELLT